MSNFKRVLSVFLVVLMIIPMFAMPTSADSDTWSIVINYLYENGNAAAPSYTATVAKGSSFKQTIESPEVQGYAPKDEYRVIVIDEASVDDNITINVTYYPTEVNFTVNHYWQNIEDDKYTLNETETKTGITESEVGDNLAKSYDGFTALLYDTTTTIAADGSTVVDIYYDRNYYLLSLDLEGGYGAEPVYARYGAQVDIATPEKPGYTFGGWSPAAPSTMPAENMKLTAQWNAGQATYLVQYWLENANDDNYSYDSSVQKSATVGSTVNGANDKSYTGFKFDHADQNVVINGDGTSVVNVYYKRNVYTVSFWTNSGYFSSSKEYTQLRITAKYGATIGDKWPTYNGSNTWATKNNGTTYQVYLETMPLNGASFYGPKTGRGSETAYYYVEVLPGETGDTVQGGITYKLHHKDTSPGTGYKVTQNDKYDLKGYTYKEGTQNGKNYNNAKFYYVRQKFNLEYNSNNVIVKTTNNIPYQTPLTEYSSYIPDYPANLEPGVYTFEGWCIDPACEKMVAWETMKMPDSNVMVYAKWTPKTHTVRTFLTKDKIAASEYIDIWENIPHRSTIARPDNPVNGQYVFVGWFYEENGVEKAYDFSIAITKDLDLYAKWSSNTLVEYTIHYELEDGTAIADVTNGSALAGTTKTFEAKFGEELYEGYTTGYYPITSSHSVTMDIEGNNVYTFVYVEKEKVNYTVRYLEIGTENVLHEEKSVETSDNIVTERFVPVSGYIPDASFKRLILSADDSENVITFWYKKDTEHALVTVIHYVQNIEGNSYTEYRTTTYTGDIGKTYTEDPLTINGFTYNEAKSTASGELTSQGLELTLFYDRNEYEYEFKFVDRTTGDIIHDSVTGKARYGAQVTKSYIDLESDGYMLDSSENLSIIISQNDNFATFYYVPFFTVVHVKHDSENVINTSTEKVKITTRDMKYSLTGAVSHDYLYGGAFDDVDCTSENVHDFGSENAIEFTPVKGSTYYIWEVPEHYLVPRSYSVWRHIPEENGQIGVVKLFLLTTIDRTEYREVGFIMDEVNYPSTADETGSTAANTPTTYGVVNVTKSSELYEQLYVKNGAISSANAETDERARDKGYIGLYKLSSEQFDEFSSNAGNSVTFTPYWITLDGIEVTGVKSRTCTYRGLGEQKVTVGDKETSSALSAIAEATSETMAFCAEYILSDGIEAVEPVEPIDTPEPIEETVTVTVCDYYDTYDIECKPGDITSEIKYIGVDGMLFAGWFEDINYRTPADFTEVYDDITVYAKYVNDSYLQVERVTPKLNDSEYIVTAIDSTDYIETGFIINEKTYSVDDYSSKIGMYSARQLFGRGVSASAKLVSVEIPEDDNILVTPYWITLDGTTVYGTSATYSNYKNFYRFW